VAVKMITFVDMVKVL